MRARCDHLRRMNEARREPSAQRRLARLATKSLPALPGSLDHVLTAAPKVAAVNRHRPYPWVLGLDADYSRRVCDGEWTVCRWGCLGGPCPLVGCRKPPRGQELVDVTPETLTAAQGAFGKKLGASTVGAAYAEALQARREAGQRFGAYLVRRRAHSPRRPGLPRREASAGAATTLSS